MKKPTMKEHQETMQEKADLLKALGNPVRLCILQKLLDEEQCTVTYFTNCMEASQSTVSQHLAKLRAQNIVSVRKDGTNAHYSIKDEQTKKILRLLFEEN